MLAVRILDEMLIPLFVVVLLGSLVVAGWARSLNASASGYHPALPLTMSPQATPASTDTADSH